MISFIKGTIEILKNDFIILENNGIGYKIFVSQNTLSYLNTNNNNNNNNLKLFTYTHFTQDNLSLFGFLTIEELEIFQKLITVSGVGVKSAISLLGSLSPNDIITAILSGDIKTLCLGQGIGKKGAERIILELKDKLDIADIFNKDDDYNSNTIISLVGNQENINETIEALVSLGFSKSEVLKAISSINSDISNIDLESSKLIALCLKKLSS